MSGVKEEFAKIKKQAESTLARVVSAELLENFRVEYLGRKGALSILLRQLKDLPETERRSLGVEANALRRSLEEKFAKLAGQLKNIVSSEVLKRERLDVTRPGVPAPRGHLHPITQVLRQVEDIFMRLGFTVAEGPEIETEHYNFDALNIPANHPARDMWDTFWLRGNQNEIPNSKFQIPNKFQNSKSKFQKLLLRTHTSPVQIRYMETHEPPVRIIVPGVVYRYEATDASHDIEFWQLEGLMVDRDVTIANFKAVIERFFSELFGGKVKIRLRPSYFPFVEPGFEVDVSCVQCKGKGCSVCGQSGWLEMMGAGMVHPNVFRAVGYNPSPPAGGVQGFAFGMGLDRITMMKYKIPDIRLMRGGDLRFLQQF